MPPTVPLNAMGSKGEMVRFVGWIVGLILLAVLTGCGDSVSWNQKLTVEVETPDGVKTASSVSYASYYAGIPGVFGDMSGAGYKFRGEAVVLEVAKNRYLFVLTRGIKTLARSLTVLQVRDAAEGMRQFKKRTIPLFVPHKHMPMMVTFDDTSEPKTIKLVKPDDFAAIFGPGYALREVRLEPTNDPVTKGRVEKALVWWCDYREPYKRLSGKSGVISDNNLANNLGPGAFKIGECE